MIIDFESRRKKFPHVKSVYTFYSLHTLHTLQVKFWEEIAYHPRAMAININIANILDSPAKRGINFCLIFPYNFDYVLPAFRDLLYGFQRLLAELQAILEYLGYQPNIALRRF